MNNYNDNYIESLINGELLEDSPINNSDDYSEESDA